ncbi:MAG: hypothetical protein R2882_06045 [Gemmatimonadales bacterium]
MQRQVTRKLEMAIRARNFVRAHPFSDPTHVAITDRLDAEVTRAQGLAVREQTGRLDANAAVRHRKELRRALQQDLVRYVARVGAVAAQAHPELASRLEAPKSHATNAVFLARAWELLEMTKANLELLAAHGLAASQVEELAAALTRYEAVTERADAGRRLHIGARAELVSLVADLAELIRLLDSLSRMQFREDPELLAAWDSARNVVTGPTPKANVSAEKSAAPPAAGSQLGRAA